MKQSDSLKTPTRRALLRSGLGVGALLAHPVAAFAAAPPGFDQWRDGFRARALAKGISEATWTRVMGRIEPDMTVFKQMQKQPEFNEQIWQYVNRRVSDWRIIAGKEALKKNEALFARIEQDFGVERGTLLALWGVESAYGDPLVQQNHMRPGFPSLAALAWDGARRRRGGDRGPARWDIPSGCRKSGSMSEWITTGMAGYRRSESPTMRSDPARAFWSIAASIAAASIGAMKCARPVLPQAAAGPTRRGPAPAFHARTGSRSRSRAHPRKCGCRCKAGRHSCSVRISMQCAAITLR